MEILTFITISVLLIISGVSNAIMDTIKFKYSRSIFSTLNNQRWYEPSSWKNKYKNRNPEMGEAFWGSTTIFVFLTNAWHFFQMIWRVSFTLSVVLGLFVLIEWSIL